MDVDRSAPAREAAEMEITSRLEEVDPPRRIARTGRAPGLGAVHVWTFAATSTGTHVRTEDSFSGLLGRILPGRVTGVTRRTLASSLARGLAALRDECERRAGPASPAA